MKTFFGFIASGTGRVIRAIAGLALMGGGLVILGGAWGVVLAIVGFVPLAAGVFDFCVFAPLFGYPFDGQSLRAVAQEVTTKPSRA